MFRQLGYGDNPYRHCTWCQSDHQHNTTASFGVATFDFEDVREAMTMDSLIATADDMLYLAKSGGRNQVRALQLP